MANWKKVKLEEICTVEWGNSELTKASYIPDGEYLAVSAAGCDGRIGHREHAKNTPVISAIGANCGRMFLPREDFTAIKNTITITPVDGVSDGRYLYEVLTFTELPKRGGAQPFMSKGDIESFKIGVPPLAEQRKIAEILRTWDEAIEAAEAELKAKQERKRWIMDRLFKFAPEEQLEVMKMQSAVDIVKGEQLNRHTLADSGSFPVWNGGVTPSGYTESYNTEGPAVIMSEGGNSCGAITYVRSNFWRGGHCYQVVPNQGFTNDYIFAALKYYEPQVMRLRVGSGLPNIQKKTFLAWGAPLHKSAFREKVAIMFSQAQLEANLASSRIDFLRAQKRGLMQKLLTGEVRVAA